MFTHSPENLMELETPNFDPSTLALGTVALATAFDLSASLTLLDAPADGALASCLAETFAASFSRKGHALRFVFVRDRSGDDRIHRRGGHRLESGGQGDRMLLPVPGVGSRDSGDGSPGHWGRKRHARHALGEDQGLWQEENSDWTERELEATGGRVSVIGELSGWTGEITLGPIVTKALTVSGVYVGNRDNFIRMLRMLRTTCMKPHISARFGLEETGLAFYLLEKGSHTGKIVISLP